MTEAIVCVAASDRPGGAATPVERRAKGPSPTAPQLSDYGVWLGSFALVADAAVA